MISLQVSNIGLGYNITHANEATRIALREAHDAVREVTDAGVKMRDWSVSIRKRVHEFFDSAPREGRAEQANKAERLEREIAESVRGYFAVIAKGMVKLKTLNPPLRSDQIEPYLEMILTDRRETMARLEPLSQILDRLQTAKYHFAQIRPL